MKRTVMTGLCVAAAAAMTGPAWGQATVPGDKSSLYYRIGGGEPVSRAANPGSGSADRRA